MSITVIGSANVDFIMKVPRLPGPGETVTDGDYVQVFGGKGANTATAAARSGGSVAFMACMGDEHFGRQMMQNFLQDGIDTKSTVLLENESCGTALIMVDSDGENCISVAPGTNFSLSPEMVASYASQIADSDMVLLQMEIPIATNAEVLRIAAEHKVPVLVNYAPVRAEPLGLSSAIHYLVVNEVEAAALSNMSVTDIDEATSAAVALRQQGPGIVVVTLGADGVVVASDDGEFSVPAFEVEVVDTTSAGDTFCGALATAIVEGKTIEEATRFACAASALCVTRVGAQPSIPTRSDIEDFLAQHTGESP